MANSTARRSLLKKEPGEHFNSATTQSLATSAGQVLDLSFISIGTQDSARASLAKIDQAINEMGSVRGKVGALTNRLTHTLDFTANAIESVKSSKATVRDTDYAWQTAKLAKNEILKQATAAVFGMSQPSSDIALSLLQF